MANIRVKDLEVGMNLADDVCDLNGRFLIAKDCELTAKHIKALNAWGVISVEIYGDNTESENGESETEITSEEFDRFHKKLSSEFIHNDLEHPFIAELITEVTKYILNKKLKSNDNFS